MRRLAIGAVGLAVAVLAAAACVLSFDDLRALVLRAGARENLAHLYPAAFDALLVTALISFLLLGTARPLVRAQAGLVLLVLLAAASWANVAMAMRVTIDARLGAAIVGVVPWLMLLIGLWLLMLLIRHAQVRRAGYEGTSGAGSPDIVPFDRDDAAADGTTPGNAAPERATGGDTTPKESRAETTVTNRPPAAPEHAAPEHVGTAHPAAERAGAEPAAEPERAERADTGPVATAEAVDDEPAPPAAEPAEESVTQAAASATGQEPVRVSHEPPVPAPTTEPSPVPATPAVSTSPAAPTSGPGDRSPRSKERSPDPSPTPLAQPVAETSARVPTAPPDESGHGSGEPAPVAEQGRRRGWFRRSEKTGKAVADVAAVDSRPGGGGKIAGAEARDEPESRPHADAGDAEGGTGAAPTAGPSESPKRPIRWGDLLRPPSGDVLVHPRREQVTGTASAEGTGPGSGGAVTPKAEARSAEVTDWEPEETDAGPQETDASTDEAEAVTVETAARVWPPGAARGHESAATAQQAVTAQEDERHPVATRAEHATGAAGDFADDGDTRPYPHLRERSEPLPSPTPEAADAEPGEHAPTRDSAAGGPTVPLAPPSGRMRSTPVPPQD